MLLKTDRLYLRKFTTDDVEKTFLYSREESRKRGIPNEVYADMRAARDVVLFVIACYEFNEYPFVYAVALKTTDEYIGHVSLSRIKEGVEIGYAICEAHQGNGYATEIARAFAAWGKRELALETIYGLALSDNAASIAVLKKAGFGFLRTDAVRGCEIYAV